MRGHLAARASLLACARLRTWACLLACAAALTGCSIAGDGESTNGNPVNFLITQGFGSERVGSEVYDDLPAGSTVMRLLQRSFAVDTAYGGRFVTAINGIAASKSPARDWIYYLNGHEAPEGAAATRVEPGDRVQWDYHRWDAITIGKEIVGAYPQPLIAGGARIVCLKPGDTDCESATKRLREATIPIATEKAGTPVVVGRVSDLVAREGVPSLARPVDDSGLFVRLKDGALELYDEAAKPRRNLGKGEGVVFAAESEQGPVWFVLGADAAGEAAAVKLLDEPSLSGWFALAVAADGAITGLPVTGAP